MSGTGSNVKVYRPTGWTPTDGRRYSVSVDGVRVGWVCQLGSRWDAYTRIVGKPAGAKVAHQLDRRFAAVDAIVTNVRYHQPDLIAKLAEQDRTPQP